MNFIGAITDEIEPSGHYRNAFRRIWKPVPNHSPRLRLTVLVSPGASTKLHVHASLHVQRCDGFTTGDRARHTRRNLFRNRPRLHVIFT